MARRLEYLFANPKSVFRSMGEDLVVVDDSNDKVIILNATSRMILDAVLRGVDSNGIVKLLRKHFIVEEKIDLKDIVSQTRKKLVEAGVLVTKRNFADPIIDVRDLSTALEGLDLESSTVSQYE